jgi:hypothetical protein
VLSLNFFALQKTISEKLRHPAPPVITLLRETILEGDHNNGQDARG